MEFELGEFISEGQLHNRRNKMKLTNEQKGYNAAIKTGIKALEAKITKMNSKLKELEEDLEYYKGVVSTVRDTTLLESRIIVTENDIYLRSSMNKQLLTAIEVLKGQLL